VQSTHKMLLAIDDSEATARAVAYVASVVRAAPQFDIRLFHVLPPIPPALLEHGGHTDPVQQVAVERELDRETAVWRERCEREAAGLISATRETLEEAGVAPERITVSFKAPLPEDSVGPHIAAAARTQDCDTVVVGRAPRSWIGGVFYRHPSGSLLDRKASGIAVWIVT